MISLPDLGCKFKYTAYVHKWLEQGLAVSWSFPSAGPTPSPTLLTLKLHRLRKQFLQLVVLAQSSADILLECYFHTRFFDSFFHHSRPVHIRLWAGKLLTNLSYIKGASVPCCRLIFLGLNVPLIRQNMNVLHQNRYMSLDFALLTLI